MTAAAASLSTGRQNNISFFAFLKKGGEIVEVTWETLYYVVGIMAFIIGLIIDNGKKK